ncbi:MAG TPA: DUF3365 domain-containing protein [Candidatus Krumholzibacteria bacterium]|nr:DUF3365 domain-containing protein [Candidatus Krumholzibacteria bacterium]
MIQRFQRSLLSAAGMAVALVLVAAGCGGGGGEARGDRPEGSAQQAGAEDFAADAKAATNRLQVALKKELSAAMQEGGPVAAIEVCHTRAPEIAREVGTQTELDVARVSRNNRNPANAPSDVEASVLEAFEARPAMQDTVFTRDGERTYMRAIRIGTALCLNCHGPESTLEPELKGRLDELYPQDRATGFEVGDLRGAFVVR